MPIKKKSKELRNRSFTDKSDLAKTLPLITLTSATSFRWTKSHSTCFEEAKIALTTAPVLALPDHSKPVELISDASINGIGAVLMQDQHPVAYYSKNLSDAEKNYTTGEQELLATYSALKEFRCYLEGPKILLVTDPGKRPCQFCTSHACRI